MIIRAVECFSYVKNQWRNLCSKRLRTSNCCVCSHHATCVHHAMWSYECTKSQMMDCYIRIMLHMFKRVFLTKLSCLSYMCIIVWCWWHSACIRMFHVSRLMCWFGARWNVQRNVTCIVICTIPWTNRYVNTYRDVWAHPAHVCFSAYCIKSQI